MAKLQDEPLYHHPLFKESFSSGQDRKLIFNISFLLDDALITGGAVHDNCSILMRVQIRTGNVQFISPGSYRIHLQDSHINLIKISGLAKAAGWIREHML